MTEDDVYYAVQNRRKALNKAQKVIIKRNKKILQLEYANKMLQAQLVLMQAVAPDIEKRSAVAKDNGNGINQSAHVEEITEAEEIEQANIDKWFNYYEAADGAGVARSLHKAIQKRMVPFPSFSELKEEEPVPQIHVSNYEEKIAAAEKAAEIKKRLDRWKKETFQIVKNKANVKNKLR